MTVAHSSAGVPLGSPANLRLQHALADYLVDSRLDEGRINRPAVPVPVDEVNFPLEGQAEMGRDNPHTYAAYKTFRKA